MDFNVKHFTNNVDYLYQANNSPAPKSIAT